MFVSSVTLKVVEFVIFFDSAMASLSTLSPSPSVFRRLSQVSVAWTLTQQQLIVESFTHELHLLKQEILYFCPKNVKWCDDVRCLSCKSIMSKLGVRYKTGATKEQKGLCLQGCGIHPKVGNGCMLSLPVCPMQVQKRSPDSLTTAFVGSRSGNCWEEISQAVRAMMPPSMSDQVCQSMPAANIVKYQASMYSERRQIHIAKTE